MRILLVYPNRDLTTRMPLGVCFISSYLKREGHIVEAFDATFFKREGAQNDDNLRAVSLQVRNPDFKEYGVDEDKLDVYTAFERKINSFKPDFVGVSVVDPNYTLGIGLLQRLKQKHKKIFTMMGGPTVTFAPEEVIAQDCVDALCVGEGEEAVAEFCGLMGQDKDITSVKNVWIKKDNKIYRNDVRTLINLDTLLAPDWDIFDQRHLIRPLGGKMYRMGIFSITRGCLFRCTYCANFALGEIYKDKGFLYRIRRPEAAIKEMRYYKNKYDLNFIFFVDDIFPLHKSEILEEFCYLYKKEIALPFSVSLHAELIKEKQFAQLVDAGCCNVCVGLESGSQRIRQDIFERRCRDEQIINAFSLARKYGIRSSAFNIIGIPGETRKEIFETIELNRRANPTTTTLTFLHPYRGTKIRDLCIRAKYFDPTKERDYEKGYRMETCLNMPQVSSKTLSGIFKTFQLYFKLPKCFYPFIRLAEGNSCFANSIFNFLKKIFYRITSKEAEWDFSLPVAREKKLGRREWLNKTIF
jgi:radical SAM superfamily enzyme YgiQ (UPF0313 family)